MREKSAGVDAKGRLLIASDVAKLQLAVEKTWPEGTAPRSSVYLAGFLCKRYIRSYNVVDFPRRPISV